MLTKRIFLSLLLIGSFYISKPTAGLAQDMYATNDGRPPDVYAAAAGVCGNGVREDPEQCDSGSMNGTATCACSGSCTWKTSSSSSTTSATATMAP